MTQRIRFSFQKRSDDEKRMRVWAYDSVQYLYKIDIREVRFLTERFLM